MKKIILSLVISLGITGVAFAKGDIAAGKAKSVTCAACHGAEGVSPAPNWPNLAGQGERLSGQTNHRNQKWRPLCSGNDAFLLPNLTPQDIEDLSAFYASQPAPSGVTDPKYVSLGEAIYRGGDAKKGIPACSACHSPTGQGNYLAAYPMLAGQKADYTAKQLRGHAGRGPHQRRRYQKSCAPLPKR